MELPEVAPALPAILSLSARSIRTRSGVTLTTSPPRAYAVPRPAPTRAVARKAEEAQTVCRRLRPVQRMGPMSHDPHRPARSRVALVTGVGRRRSIGAELALGLAADGWDLALGHWQPYDERLGYERGEDDPAAVAEECRALGSRVELLPGDLADPSTPEALVAAATERLGPVTGCVMSHCESVDSGILSTSLESWDRHYAVNARATWLLIRAFAERLPAQAPGGPAAAHVVALTSDHTAHNLPYGSSKGALDRIVIAAALELADRGLRGQRRSTPARSTPGWMDDRIRALGVAETPAGRLGTPSDTADLVRLPLLRGRAAGSTASCSTATAASRPRERVAQAGVRVGRLEDVEGRLLVGMRGPERRDDVGAQVRSRTSSTRFSSTVSRSPTAPMVGVAPSRGRNRPVPRDTKAQSR